MAGKFPGEQSMEIGSLIRIALNAGAEKLFREEMPLRAGDLLRLKVIDVREDNRALVDFGKFRALAEVAFPVSAGDELTVKVIDTKGQLRLTLVPAGAETAPAPARCRAGEALCRAKPDTAPAAAGAGRGGDREALRPGRLRCDPQRHRRAAAVSRAPADGCRRRPDDAPGAIAV